MSLEGLFPLLSQAPQYRGLLDLLGRGEAGGRLVLPDAALPYCVGALRKELKVPVLIAVSRPERARRLHEDLLTWCGEDARVYPFLEGETLPFERLMADDATTHGRITALSALLRPDGQHGEPPIVVASLAALAQKTMSRETFQASCHYVTVGQRVNLGALMERWQRTGYRVARAVEIPGTVSRRGGILDIYLPGADLPARIELLGDVVESIRLFDPASQRSMSPVQEVFILPAQEALPSLTPRAEVEERYRHLDPSNCTPDTRDRIQEEMSMLLAGHALEEPGFYQGFFCRGTVLDFLPREGLLVVERPGEVEEEGHRLDEKARDLREAKEARGEVPRDFPSPQMPWQELNARLSSLPTRLDTSPWPQDPIHSSGTSLHEPGFTPPRSYLGRLDVLSEDARVWRQEGDRAVVVSHHASRLAEVFQEHGVTVDVDTAVTQAPGEGSLILVRGSLSEGLSLPIGGSTLHLLTDVEVMGRAKERPLRKRAPVERATFLSELEPGSYLVHTEHGIGRFVSTQPMGLANGEREYLVLEYAEGDRLYVPTDQLDRVSPYVAPGERSPVLTRLGTQEWSRSKAKARASTRELAQHLLTLYASREVVEGFSFSPDSPWQRELEDSFPYEETSDQLESIHEVKTDMEHSRPMDRLVCGDVGYGKTEVALRAAFKAVMDGRQVAVLVPTTVLAQQHYSTFSQRLAPFPLQVEVLSRFRTTEEQREVIERLASGKVDICIGTHRLVQKDVAFKNLGLVIVDEEQRFGVRHKERLKDVSKAVDVLTLSATPIPRTLHIALSGIRDMSTIETPPEERLSIKTYVSEYSEEVVREAILREMDRGGQVFFLHNRVRTIQETAEKIRTLVPEATVAVGHGQMPEDGLEQVMAEFAQGMHDVLVCTTIIAAGLDMPNANTLVIDRADMLGLAQLYQLRGRIGRGATRAYSYLMVPPNRRISETAEKRLKTILAATELGSGFRIAMRDLEIRGAGNILGPQQSGHIHAVGYDLYSQMLAEAVEELRGEQDGVAPDRAAQAAEVTLDLPLAAYIPLEYVPDLSTRLGVYQRLARLRRREDVASLRDEILDRFGPIPEAVDELLYVVELKAQAYEAGAGSISQDGKVAVIQLREPVGGARVVLQKALGRAVQVGHSQVRVPIQEGWQRALMDTLASLVSFKARMVELSGTG